MMNRAARESRGAADISRGLADINCAWWTEGGKHIICVLAKPFCDKIYLG